jgi:hypothetical protein
MEPQTVLDNTSHELADDLLRGADEIAKFIFGEKRGNRRKVYYLAECTRLPVFRLGSVLCARRSVLLSWIAGQENSALATSKRAGLCANSRSSA